MQELIQLEDDFCGYKGLRNLELSDVLEDVSSEADSQQAVKLFYRLKELLKNVQMKNVNGNL